VADWARMATGAARLRLGGRRQRCWARRQRAVGRVALAARVERLGGVPHLGPLTPSSACTVRVRIAPAVGIVNAVLVGRGDRAHEAMECQSLSACSVRAGFTTGWLAALPGWPRSRRWQPQAGRGRRGCGTPRPAARAQCRSSGGSFCSKSVEPEGLSTTAGPCGILGAYAAGPCASDQRARGRLPGSGRGS
jgi:hypothetical protein